MDMFKKANNRKPMVLSFLIVSYSYPTITTTTGIITSSSSLIIEKHWGRKLQYNKWEHENGHTLSYTWTPSMSILFPTVTVNGCQERGRPGKYLSKEYVS